MAILNFSEETRDYVLEAEREGYWDKVIQKAEKELSEMKADDEDYEVKSEELENLKKEAEKAKKLLAKYGPTVWQLHSIDKLALSRALAKDNLEIGTVKGRRMSKNTFTTADLALVTIRAVQICKLGLDGWSNLRDKNGNEIPFNRNLIPRLDTGILYELANEISGEVGADEAENLN